MNRARNALLVILALLLLLSGCNSILEGEKLQITPHAQQSPDNLADVIPEITDYDALLAELTAQIRRGAELGLARVLDYSGDLEPDLRRARTELLTRDPLGAYALSELTLTATPVVSIFEVDIAMTYRRSRGQINAVVPIDTEAALETELLTVLTKYRAEAALLTTLPGVTAESVVRELETLYYDNPLLVVMLPVIVVNIYPAGADGTEPRIIELQLGYSPSADVLSAFASHFGVTAESIAAQAEGRNDGERLLALCERLAELVEYDAAAADLADYLPQSFAATAYGALSNGSAIGEGYAMAYKALCDKLALDCRVVRGERGEKRYAWNIVAYDGAYYHVDAAQCDELGFAASFFRTDRDMAAAGYVWPEEYPPCDGAETYYTISGRNTAPPQTPPPTPTPTYNPAVSPGVTPPAAPDTPEESPEPPIPSDTPPQETADEEIIESEETNP
ncbi:MAG: hypothetical protein LBT36_00345 [Oscillospiraceae bacterium]|jgi:hypothetical protein|nr:hypothetical protein [Oscillospiraceae bacterium]